jgi:dimethylargininase
MNLSLAAASPCEYWRASQDGNESWAPAAVRIFDFTDAIVRLPGRSVVRGILKSPEIVPEFDRVMAEHTAYVEALRSAGLTVEVLPPLEEFPDSVFVEDPALVFSGGAVLLRPGTPTRVGESDGMRPVLLRRFQRVLELSGEEYADGGDVLTARDGVFIETPPGSLHLKSAVSVLDEETFLTSAAIAESGIFRDYQLLVALDEEPSAHALRVNNMVFVPAHFPRTADLLAVKGYEVKTLQVTEIRKLDAGLPCMSLRWLHNL